MFFLFVWSWRSCIKINMKLFQEFPFKLMKNLKANEMLCFEWFEYLTRLKCWVLKLCVPKTFEYFTENYFHNFMSSFMLINSSYYMSHISIHWLITLEIRVGRISWCQNFECTLDERFRSVMSQFYKCVLTIDSIVLRSIKYKALRIHSG